MSGVSQPVVQRSVFGRLLNPYLQLGICIVVSAAAQIFLKLGADSAEVGGPVASLRSGWVWLGMIALVGSLVSWLIALRTIPLIIAFNLVGATQVLVPLGSWVFLGEAIGPLRWVGILLVTLGVVIIARPLARMEDRL
jgi:multidrug transporter EmrE-like cation transporter